MSLFFGIKQNKSEDKILLEKYKIYLIVII